MSDKPILLFLHGVGSGDLADHWKEALAGSLMELGYPGLDAAKVIAPKYPKALLYGSDDEVPLPELTIKALAGDVGRENHRAFARRTSAIEVRIGRHDCGVGLVGGPVVVDGTLHAPGLFNRAKNYLGDRNVRALVLRRILDRLPATGHLVLVGHSLGSVIAADLLRRLPADLKVVGMVTIGSPLANAEFHVHGLRGTLKEPPTNLGWWVNFWNPADPVTAGRGVSYGFPWVLDRRVQTRVGLNVHDAETYLANEAVAAAIGYALYGSLSKELAVVDKGVDLRLDTLETWALLALRYGYLTKTKLEGEQQERFASALRQVQADAFSRIVERNDREARPLPALIAGLAVDLSDPASIAPEPGRVHHLSTEDAVVILTSLAASNIIQPFEIKVPAEVQRRALEDLAVELGLGSQFGSDVVAAALEAGKTLSGDGPNWVKWVAIGVGSAAILLTGGLAIAAAPAGLAGAAAITSALAAFGPGGMIGGLLTAGVLVSVGTGGIATGLASPTTSAATVEVFVSNHLAAAILRRRQGIDQDPATWASLAETGIELRRARVRLEAVSDGSAPTLKELKRKLEAIDRALTYLSQAGLGPGGTEGSDAGKRPGAEFLGRATEAFRSVNVDGDGVPDKPRAAAVMEDAGAAIKGAAGAVAAVFQRKPAGSAASGDADPELAGDPGADVLAGSGGE